MPPTLDMDKIKELASALREGALTIGEIQARSGISRRTAYRWIDTLEAQGLDVVRKRTPHGYAFAILGQARPGADSGPLKSPQTP